MAIPVLKMKAISRGNDEWVVAAASYRAGEKLYDDRAGKTHDYSNRAGVRESGITLAANAPEWAADRGQLWNNVEGNEKRKDAQLAKEVTVPLPYELDNDQQKSLLLSYINNTFTDKGIVVDWAIHDPEPANAGDPRNPHAHLLFPLRTFDDAGEWSKYKSGGQDQPWDKTPFLYEVRSQWEVHVNTSLELAGSDARISMKSYAEQGIDRMGGVHLGKEAYAMEKQGTATDRGNKQLEIEAFNASKGWQDVGEFAEASSTIERVRSRYSTPQEASQAYQRIDYIITQESEASEWNENTSYSEHLDLRATEIQDSVSMSQPPPAIEITRQTAPFELTAANDNQPQDTAMEAPEREPEFDESQIKEIVDEKRMQDAQVASAAFQPAEDAQQPVVVANPVDNTQEVQVPEADSAVVVDQDELSIPDAGDTATPVTDINDELSIPEYDPDAPDGLGDAPPPAEEPPADVPEM